MTQQNLGDASLTNLVANSPTNSLVDLKYQKSEPFLWFHIALLAAVPLALILGMVGLGVGDPIFPEWFEISIIGLPPIALPVILQWWKPLSPFSLWLYAKPLELTDDNERRILAVVKNFKTGLIAIAIGFVTDAIFCQMYTDAPLVAGVLPFPAGLRILGIIWSLVFFAIGNLLLQAGAVAIRVLLLSEADLDKLTPLPLENIKAFTSIGKRSPKLLDFKTDSPKNLANTQPSKPSKVEKVSQMEVSVEIARTSEIPRTQTELPEAPENIESANSDIDLEAPEPYISDAQILSEIKSQIESEVSELIANKTEVTELPEVSVEESIVISETTISVIESAWESPVTEKN